MADHSSTAATALAGFSVGSTVGYSLTTSLGQETTYSGSVGSIAAADFEQHRYAFGLFTYYRADAESGQSYQVINYWVE